MRHWIMQVYRRQFRGGGWGQGWVGECRCGMGRNEKNAEVEGII